MHYISQFNDHMVEVLGSDPLFHLPLQFVICSNFNQGSFISEMWNEPHLSVYFETLMFYWKVNGFCQEQGFFVRWTFLLNVKFDSDNEFQKFTAIKK